MLININELEKHPIVYRLRLGYGFSDYKNFQCAGEVRDFLTEKLDESNILEGLISTDPIGDITELVKGKFNEMSKSFGRKIGVSKAISRLEIELESENRDGSELSFCLKCSFSQIAFIYDGIKTAESKIVYLNFSAIANDNRTFIIPHCDGDSDIEKACRFAANYSFSSSFNMYRVKHCYDYLINNGFILASSYVHAYGDNSFSYSCTLSNNEVKVHLDECHLYLETCKELNWRDDQPQFWLDGPRVDLKDVLDLIVLCTKGEAATYTVYEKYISSFKGRGTEECRTKIVSPKLLKSANDIFKFIKGPTSREDNYICATMEKNGKVIATCDSKNYENPENWKFMEEY